MVAVWGSLLLAFSLFFTLSLARFFFFDSASYATYPSPLTLIRQGVTTPATVTNVGFTCTFLKGRGSISSVTIQYQDLHNVTHSIAMGCALKNATVGETFAIRYVGGYSGVDLQQDYQGMLGYYRSLLAIIAVQILVAMVLLSIAAKARSTPRFKRNQQQESAPKPDPVLS
jgi:hypothetical protein